MSGTSVDGVDVALIETDGGRSPFWPDADRPLFADEVAPRSVRRSATEQPQRGDGRRLSEARDRAPCRRRRRCSGPTHGDRPGHARPGRLSWPDRSCTGRSAADRSDRRRRGARRGDSASRGQRLSQRRRRGGRAGRAAGAGVPSPRWRATLPRPLAVLNIGGVANVTWIGEDGALLAFDTGPGNAPIDDWCARRAGQRFDPTARSRRGQGRSHASSSAARPPLFRAASRRSRSTAATSTIPGRWPLGAPTARRR